MGPNVIEWLPAVLHWELQGTPGAKLDQWVAVLVNAGHAAEVIEPAKAYRIGGDPLKLNAIAQQLAADEDISLAIEAPSEEHVEITTSVTPMRPHRRSVFIQGQGVAVTLVARAVDAGLHVEAAGRSRWRVHGPTAALMNWLATHAHAATMDETLAAWGLDPAQVAAEDADADVPLVRVLLPARRKTTAIERDSRGDMVSVTSIETDMTHDDEIDGQPAAD